MSISIKVPVGCVGDILTDMQLQARELAKLEEALGPLLKSGRLDLDAGVSWTDGVPEPVAFRTRVQRVAK